MVIRDAKKYSSAGTAQKKDKMKKATRNPVVIIIDDDDAQLGLPTKAKRGEKKHSVEGNSSIPKKKKKKKKKPDSKLKTDPPITIQSSSDLGSVKEAENPPEALKKKRKRGLSRERESSPGIPSQGQTICLEANFLVRKKCKRSVPETCGGNNEHDRKRKKKKRKLACPLIPSHAADDYSKKDFSPAMEMISHETMLSKRKRTLIQRDVSKGKSKPICCLTSMDSQETRSGVLEKGTTDPTCERQEENNCKQDHKDSAHTSKKRRQVTEQEGKKKKKKKKKKLKEEVGFPLTWAGNQENHPAVSTETLWKTKSEEKMKRIDLIQSSKGDSKGHKKKKIYTEVAGSSPDPLQDNKDASGWGGIAAARKKTKKKAPKSKKGRDPAARLGSSSNSRENSGQQCDATKRTAEKREGPERAEEEPSPKPAKAKIKAEKSKDEIQVIAIKKGNCDEGTIDKRRRQALQEEIDRESGKTKPIKKEDGSDHQFGQWSMATFDSAERKTRFLRLLGGFKKGPLLAQESPAKVTKHHMALARHEEEKLQQTLQAGFEKALVWKQRRGAGLGFQPAPQKQGHIDKYASRSVKFED